MTQKLTFLITILFLTLVLLACDLSSLVPRPPTATPTFVMARFTTATSTPPAEATRSAEVAAASPTPAGPVSPLEPGVTATRTRRASPTPAAGSAAPRPTRTATRRSLTPTLAPTRPVTTTATVDATPPPPAETPTPAPSPTPDLPPLSGRIAFSIDNGAGYYDVWVLPLPEGQPFFVIDRARQPSFSSQGQLLVNMEGSSMGEGIGLIDSNYAWLGLVSDTPEDAHPFWAPDGSRYVFDNPRMLKDPLTGADLPFIFIPCSLRRPVEEPEPKCQDVTGQSKVVPGTFPVWTDDGRIAFFTFEGNDGVYAVTSEAVARGTAAGSQPQPLTFGNGRPNDTHGFSVYFSAGSLDSNWEAYVVNLDGSGQTNLSNSPESLDGLPTVSPDGAWVAFVSDRGAKWGIWVVPAAGGQPKLLLDLSTINTNPSPWGTGERDWTTERLSWGN